MSTRPAFVQEPMPLVVSPPGSPPAAARSRVDARDLHRPVLWAGWGLVLVCLVNQTLLWWSPRFGTPQWEFATVSQTFDRMPLLVLSLLLVAVGTLPSGSVTAARAVAGLLGTLSLLAVGLAALYCLAAAVAWSGARGAPPEALSLLVRAVVKTVLVAVVYATVLAGLAATLWRRTRVRR
ncbi:MAG: hypothetical protein ABW277_24085 [Longimicrobiaceae bacterium]